MSTDLSELSNLAGFIGACLVDSDTGLMLESQASTIPFDLEAAGAANTDVVQAKNAAVKALGLNEQIEDILITLDSQIHLIRPLAANPAVFVYLALDKSKANLGMARIKLKAIEGTLKI